MPESAEGAYGRQWHTAFFSLEQCVCPTNTGHLYALLLVLGYLQKSVRNLCSYDVNMDPGFSHPWGCSQHLSPSPAKCNPKWSLSRTKFYSFPYAKVTLAIHLKTKKCWSFYWHNCSRIRIHNCLWMIRREARTTVENSVTYPSPTGTRIMLHKFLTWVLVQSQVIPFQSALTIWRGWLVRCGARLQLDQWNHLEWSACWTSNAGCTWISHQELTLAQLGQQQVTLILATLTSLGHCDILFFAY